MERGAHWCVPQLNDEFRERMDDILECYERSYDSAEPVICVDEKSKELRSTPRQASRSDRIDYEYRRHGTRNIFVACEPLAGWRDATVTSRRTKLDFARYLRKLMKGRYRRARCVHLIVDNLNTHSAKAVCEALALADPPDWLSRIRWHFTPKHASWLNAVESEISVLDRQCLNRRIASESDLRREATAWRKHRNQQRVPIRWKFNRQAAKEKFPSLYSS